MDARMSEWVLLESVGLVMFMPTDSCLVIGIFATQIWPIGRFHRSPSAPNPLGYGLHSWQAKGIPDNRFRGYYRFFATQ